MHILCSIVIQLFNKNAQDKVFLNLNIQNKQKQNKFKNEKKRKFTKKTL